MNFLNKQQGKKSEKNEIKKTYKIILQIIFLF